MVVESVSPPHVSLSLYPYQLPPSLPLSRTRIARRLTAAVTLSLLSPTRIARRLTAAVTQQSFSANPGVPFAAPALL